MTPERPNKKKKEPLTKEVRRHYTGDSGSLDSQLLCCGYPENRRKDPYVRNASNWYNFLKFAYTIDYLKQRFPADQIQWAGTLTNNPAYMFWALNQLKKGNIKPGEDDEHVKEALSVFERVKRLPTFTTKDINGFKTKADLFEAIDPFKEVKSKRKDSSDKRANGLTVMASDGKWAVVRLDTFEASRPYTLQTDWCVTVDTYFTQYSSQGPLYMFTQNDKPYALLHEPSGQFKNTNDGGMNLSETAPMLGFLNIALPALNLNSLSGELGIMQTVQQESTAINTKLKNWEKTGNPGSPPEFQTLLNKNPELLSLFPPEYLATPGGMELKSIAYDRIESMLEGTSNILRTWKRTPDILKDDKLRNSAGQKLMERDLKYNHSIYGELPDELKTPEIVEYSKAAYEKDYLSPYSHATEYSDIPKELITDGERTKAYSFWQQTIAEDPLAYSLGIISGEDQNGDSVVKIPSEFRKVVRPIVEQQWNTILSDPTKLETIFDKTSTARQGINNFYAVPDFMRAKAAPIVAPRIINLLNNMPISDEIQRTMPMIPKEFLRIPQVQQTWRNTWKKALSTVEPSYLSAEQNKELLDDPITAKILRQSWVKQLRSYPNMWNYDGLGIGEGMPAQLRNDPVIQKAYETGSIRMALEDKFDKIPANMKDNPKVQEALKRKFRRTVRKDPTRFPYSYLKAPQLLEDAQKTHADFMAQHQEKLKTWAEPLYPFLPEEYENERKSTIDNLQYQADVINHPRMQWLWKNKTFPTLIDQINKCSPWVSKPVMTGAGQENPEVLEALNNKFNIVLPQLEKDPLRYHSLQHALQQIPAGREFYKTRYLPLKLEEIRNTFTQLLNNCYSVDKVKGGSMDATIDTAWYDLPYELRGEPEVQKMIDSLYSDFLSKKLQMLESGQPVTGYLPHLVIYKEPNAGLFRQFTTEYEKMRKTQNQQLDLKQRNLQPNMVNKQLV